MHAEGVKLSRGCAYMLSDEMVVDPDADTCLSCGIVTDSAVARKLLVDLVERELGRRWRLALGELRLRYRSFCAADDSARLRGVQ